MTTTRSGRKLQCTPSRRSNAVSPRASGPAPYLPPDILKLVFSHLQSHHEIAIMMCVATTWRQAASDPELWSNVEITYRTSVDIPPSYAIHLSLKNAGLASFVKRLNNPYWKPCTGLTTLQLESSFTHKTMANITRLTSLKELVLPGVIDFSVKRNAAWLSKLTHLEKLALEGCRMLPGQLAMLVALTNLQNLSLGENDRLGDEALAPVSSLLGLRVLDIRNCGIQGRGLQYLTGLTGLEVLDLGYNSLEQPFGAALGRLSSLQTLYLTECLVDVQELHYLSSLTALKVLSLEMLVGDQDGMFQDFDYNFMFLSNLVNLKSLDVSGLHFGDLPEGPSCLTQLTALSELYMQDCYLSRSSLRWLAGMTTLRQLHIDANDFCNDAAQSLAHLTGLDYLSISVAHNMGPDGPKPLSSLTALTALDIRHSQIFDDEFAAFVGNLRQLKHLHINDSSGMSPFFAQPLSKLKALTQLEVRNCSIASPGLKALSCLTNMQILDLGHVAMGPSLPADMTSMVKLKCLKVDVNGLRGVGLKPLSSLSRLVQLDLSHNMIGARGMQYISKLTRLHELRVACCALGPTGTKHLSALKRLTCLHVYKNNLGPESVEPLSCLTKLQELDISINDIRLEGVQYLSNLTNLTNLSLSHAGLGRTGLLPLKQMVYLETLDISWNGLSRIAVRAASRLPSLKEFKASMASAGALALFDM